jgi:hypothetical protein
MPTSADASAPTTSGASPAFQLGDRVVHTARPEWGVGIVASARSEPHEGRPAQRLQIRFDRAGVKTLSTAFATLRRAGDAPAVAAESEEPALAPGADPVKVMTRLPEEASDPFTTPAARLAATLALYRFSDTGGSVLDWAAAQSGLPDPLSRFSRHELEELFSRFCVARDQQLARVSAEAVKGVPPDQLATILRAAPSAGRDALQRINRRR